MKELAFSELIIYSDCFAMIHNKLKGNSMFNKRVFGDMRRAGMGIGVSKSKLSTAMQSILEQLPVGTTNACTGPLRRLNSMGW